MEKILTIKQNINQIGAIHIIDNLSEYYVPQVQKKLYYPYYWFLFKYSVKTIFGEKTIRVPCIIDMLNKQASTVDDFEREFISVEQENIIQGKLKKLEALKSAKSYIIHAVMHKLKSLIYPEIELLEENVVYRPFWIIKCDRNGYNSFKVMVDGVTGKFQILNIVKEAK